jgi:hypothetical protein
LTKAEFVAFCGFVATQLSGDLLLKNSGFAPLPSMVQARFAARLASLQPKDGSFICLRTSAGAY